jgi:pre-mRNA cleavage complex 2 protein Pcf11
MPDELRQILGQLRTLSRTSSTALAPVPQPFNSVNTSFAGPSVAASPPTSYSHSQMAPPAPPASYSSSQSLYTYPQADSKAPSAVPPLQPPQSVASVSSAPALSGPPVSNIASLFNALVKAGVVSATATPPSNNSKPETQPSDPLRVGIREYRRTIMSQKIKLSSSEIARYV